jgi:integrase
VIDSFHFNLTKENFMGVKVREKVKGSGVWWLFIDHKGKRKSKKVGRDRKKAEEAAKKIEAKLVLEDFNLAEPNPVKVPTFAELAGVWIEDYIKPLRRESTYERYRDILKRHIFPDIGKLQLDEIKRNQLRNLFLQKKKAGLSRSMICLIRDVISGVLGYAVDEELIPGNPVTGVLKRLQLERSKQLAVEPMNDQEVQLFLDTCLQTLPATLGVFPLRIQNWHAIG